MSIENRIESIKKISAENLKILDELRSTRMEDIIENSQAADKRPSDVNAELEGVDVSLVRSDLSSERWPALAVYTKQQTGSASMSQLLVAESVASASL